jgi:hypothetical protein
MFGLSLFGLGLLALLWSWGGHWNHREIQDHGGQAVGHITDKHFSQPNDWTVNYWFLLSDGQRVSARHRGVSERLWQRLHVGDQVKVRYDLTHPSRNLVVDEGNTSIAPIIVASLLGLLFAIVGVLLVRRSFKPLGSN